MSGRFEFALTNLAATQWEAFERLASKFLSDEFPALRTMAAAHGDKGRDAQLHQPQDDPKVVLQYSATRDWSSKVRDTVRRIADTMPLVRVLIFVSPQRIGPDADDVVNWAWKDKSIRVEIRDRSWFVEREYRSVVTREAAEALSKLVVDPLLSRSSVIDPARETLSDEEARAALLYLVLQRRDDEMDRHLTRLCYDGLVRAALRNTDNEHRMPRSVIHTALQALLSTHPPEEVQEYVDRALVRLERKVLRHWQRQDEFCLTYDERNRLDNEVASFALASQVFDQEIAGTIRFVAEGMELATELLDHADVLLRVRRILERFLFERGEEFVRSLTAGQIIAFTGDEIAGVSSDDYTRHPDKSSLRMNIPALTTQVVERVLVDPSAPAHDFLRSVADGYTLFAFLRETPNVQSAVTKLFSNGEFWLDTSAVLPLLAEELLEETSRSYTHVVHAARSAGATLFVTPGVMKELGAHLDNCAYACRAGGTWRTRTPFVFAAFIWSGRPISEFQRWLETFRGTARPMDDLAEYLAEVHGIRISSLQRHVSEAPDDLRWQTEEYWREVHESRRPKDAHDPEVIKQLAEHDTENFLGVIQRRHGEEIGNPFGYSTWWLTMDGRAFGASREIAARTGVVQLDSPALSFDFLMYYLAMGPARKQLEKAKERELPLLFDTNLTDALPVDLANIAEEARRSFEGQSDRVIRREIRDRLDQEKMRQKRIGRRGMEALEDDIRTALSGQGKDKGSHR